MTATLGGPRDTLWASRYQEEFRVLFELALASRQRIVNGLDDFSYHGIVGGGFYLVAGRKTAIAESTGE
jgi:hypothetical protein